MPGTVSHFKAIHYAGLYQLSLLIPQAPDIVRPQIRHKHLVPSDNDLVRVALVVLRMVLDVLARRNKGVRGLLLAESTILVQGDEGDGTGAILLDEGSSMLCAHICKYSSLSIRCHLHMTRSEVLSELLDLVNDGQGSIAVIGRSKELRLHRRVVQDGIRKFP